MSNQALAASFETGNHDQIARWNHQLYIGEPAIIILDGKQMRITDLTETPDGRWEVTCVEWLPGKYRGIE